MSFILGGAQIGQRYGVVNAGGAVDDAAARDIWNYLHRHGVSMIDTALAYGESQRIISRMLEGKTRVITKIQGSQDIAQMEADVNRCLEELNTRCVDTVLLHNPACLLQPEGKKIWNALTRLKEAGYIRRAGVSVYDVHECMNIVRSYDIDVVQFPFNVFDQRFLDQSLQQVFSEKKVERHARSIFLQGILVRDYYDLPQHFFEFEDHFLKWKLAQSQTKTQDVVLCLAFALHAQRAGHIDHFIIGLDSLQQAQQIIASMEAAKEAYSAIPEALWASLKTAEVRLIDPRVWKKA